MQVGGNGFYFDIEVVLLLEHHYFLFAFFEAYSNGKLQLLSASEKLMIDNQISYFTIDYIVNVLYNMFQFIKEPVILYNCKAHNFTAR